MTALKAVEAVLAQAGAPLHYNEITSRILENGFWTTQGKTPAATINALLAVDILQRQGSSCFQRTGRGIFALRAWESPEHTAKTPLDPAPPVSEAGNTGEADGGPEAAESEPEDVASTSPIVPAPVRSIEMPLSFTDAAERVLQEFAGKKPMHYRVVTAKALERGLVRTAGQTPESTLYAQVLTEITRSVQRGESPRFVKHGKGLIGLSRWVRPGLAAQIEQHNAARRKQLHARLLALPPPAFEALIGKLLAALGFVEVSVTKASGDGGIDVRGTMVVGDVIRTRMAVQVKRWKNNVQAPVVQQVRGSLGTHEQGLIITTSDFSSGAREEAESPYKTPVALMNGTQLVELFVEHEIGITRTPYNLIELSENGDDE